jgi:hypothetical protein
MSNNLTNKKLRTELRRVMSDRVMKITKFSQQQTLEKFKTQRQNTLSSQNNENDIVITSKQQNNETSITFNLLIFSICFSSIITNI